MKNLLIYEIGDYLIEKGAGRRRIIFFLPFIIKAPHKFNIRRNKLSYLVSRRCFISQFETITPASSDIEPD